VFKAVPARRAAALGAGFVAAALAVEFVDELVDGVRGAALPLIRHDFGLSYAQVGLLLSVPLLAGGLIELPVGIVAGYGLRRRRVVFAGGVVFAASVAAAAGARTFPVLLASFVAFFPAAGAFGLKGA
jgi:FSR family fosmidomycin resistance protein-like MFS transporter